MNSASAPLRVLISYRHESPEHSEQVLKLAQRLRADGIDARIDRFVPPPAEGWSCWMDNELEKANRVVVVCSPGYLKSAQGTADFGQGLGVSWEWFSIKREIYTNRGAGERITPVFFRKDDEHLVPKDAWDRPRHLVDSLEGSGYQGLLRDLLGLPEVVPVPLGSGIASDSKLVRCDALSMGTQSDSASSSPRVYVSYTHDSPEHKQWVAELVERLHYDGVNVTFDYWFMEPSKNFWERITDELGKADVALLVCTEAYRAKASGQIPSGLLTEYVQIVNRARTIKEFRVVPLLREGSWKISAPTEFESSMGYDFRDPNFAAGYPKLREMLLKGWTPGPTKRSTAVS
jgi:hypothetical protein